MCGDYGITKIIYSSTIRYNPACAGTTPSRAPRRRRQPIQPRVCGDYQKCFATSMSSADTTPRVRGLRCRLLVIRAICRYNPACAGTTHPHSVCTACMPIQPRVCGDYCIASDRPCYTNDTTPRVRGLHGIPVVIIVCVRYNPACAGTTFSRLFSAFCHPIQPRVCGDYSLHSCSMKRMRDTTPRVRGLRSHQQRQPCLYRYNPACAGTT